MSGTDRLVADLTRTRRESPEKIGESLRRRRRRPLLGSTGRLFLIAADHPARGVLRVGRDPLAMADRGELLHRLLVALGRPGVDGLLATPDVVEELALLGALDEKVIFGSMNRGGLAGAVYELDDRFTAYTAEAIRAAGLDGGKMMARVADDDPGSARTLVACAEAISDLAERGLPAMVEVFASRVMNGRAENEDAPDALARAVQVVSGLGTTSAYTWLKLPVTTDMKSVLRATTLPVVLLGGDPGGRADALYRSWEEAMALPQVVGLVVGRTLLYPEHGDVARAVDEAASILAARPRAEAR